MTAILKVDTIQDTAGNNIINESSNTITIGASGDTISIPSGATITNSGTANNFGGGKVLQVVQGSTSTQVAVTAGNSADTGLTAAITPSATSSKILVICTHGLFTKTAATTYCSLSLLRSSTGIYTIGNAFYSTSDGELRLPTVGISYLDSPSSTSSVTYKTAIVCPGGSSGTIYSQYQNQPSVIQLIEIGA